MTRRKFGFECELVGNVGPVLQNLVALDLLKEPRLHYYHCRCDDCQPGRRHATFTAQEDCSVQGEIITRILRHGSNYAEEAFAGLAEALHKGRGQPGNGAGFHVHVSHQDLTPGDKVRVYRMFLRYQDDIAEMAAQASRSVRDYNSPLSLSNVAGRTGRNAFWNTDPDEFAAGERGVPCRGSWLAERTQTFEFRLWNSTRVEWRMRLAVGMSVAMVDAAKEGVNVTRDDSRTVTQVLGPFMSDDTFASLVRQSVYKEEMH